MAVGKIGNHCMLFIQTIIFTSTSTDPVQPPFEVPQWLEWLIEVSNGTIFAIVGALIAFAGVWWTTARTDRRSRIDRMTVDIREREHGRYNRFSEVVTQLASPELPVRLGGIYSLSALADEWQRESRNWDTKKLRWWNWRPKWWRTKAREIRENTLTQRNACIELLCAYLRTPPVNSNTPSKEKNERNKNKYLEQLTDGMTLETLETVPLNNIKYRIKIPEDVANFSDWALYPGSMPDWDVRTAAINIIHNHVKSGSRFIWPSELINLTGAVLEGMNFNNFQLKGINLSEARLAGTSAEKCDFRRTVFTRADLRGAKLLQSNLQEAHLERCLLNGTDLRKAALNGALMGGANLQGVVLRYEEKSSMSKRKGVENTNIYHADLRDVGLSYADLQNAMLMGINLRGATMFKVRIKGADLRNAHLEKADITIAPEDINLDNYDLRNINLEFSSFDNWPYRTPISMKNADLRGANIQRARLGLIDLRGAKLTNAKLGGADLSKVDLRDADLGIETANEVTLVAHHRFMIFFHNVTIPEFNDEKYWPKGVNLMAVARRQKNELLKTLPRRRVFSDRHLR